MFPKIVSTWFMPRPGGKSLIISVKGRYGEYNRISLAAKYVSIRLLHQNQWETDSAAAGEYNLPNFEVILEWVVVVDAG